ncbi:MAG: efflux RND transporter periplasmic adaptor subunit [Planctomycetes bacterium]|nr:efflux RND transporter periplasmic adaptor subunit [Planctomycetota bacterium]
MVSGWRVRLRRPEARRPQEVAARYRAPERPPPRLRKWFGWLVPILILAGVPSFYWIKKHGVIEVSGVVDGRLFPIGTPIQGRLGAVLVSLGDPVKRDQELARLATEVLDARVREQEGMVGAARATCREREADWKVNADLASQGYAPYADARRLRHALEAALAELEAAEAALTAAVENRKLAIIRAPVTGIVLWEPLRPGAIVDHDDPVMYILEDGDLWIEAYVPEKNRAYVHPGLRADVRIDGLPGHVLRGRVARLFKAVKERPGQMRTHDMPGTPYVPVKIVLDDPALLKLYASYGMTSRARIFLD